MSRPSSARQSDTRVPSRRPSPTTLAVANAEQATTIVSREATFRDGALLILSYESDNIFIYSSLSYEHVLDSALANIAALRDPRIERSQLRLAVQTRIGSAETLVQVTPDTWPAVATRAQVVTLLVQQPLSASLSPGSRPKLPLVSHTLTSPPQELQPSSSWTENPQSPRQPSWHAPYSSTTYPASAQSAPSPDRGGRSQGHPRQPSQVVTNGPPATHYPYAHVHYVPSTPNTVSPTTDVSFMNVRPLSDAERRRDRQDVSYHTEPPKRRWEQVEDAGPEERTTYSSGSSHVGGSYSGSARPGFSAQTEQQKDTRPNKRANPRLEPPRPSVYLQALSKDRFSSMEEGGCFWLQAVYAVRVRPKGPDGPKTLCNACGLSYAKEAARREAAASASSAQAQNLQDQPTSYAHGSDSATNSSRRATGVKTLDGSSTTLSKPDGVFPGQVTSSDSTAPSGQPSRECTTCRRTDSPQWRKGPEGPNTLCNSCGLSWARTQRKSEGIPSRAASSRSASPVAPAYQPSQLAPAVIDPSTPQTESRGRAAPKSLLRNNSDDDEHIRPSPVASLRSRSPENAEGRA